MKNNRRWLSTSNNSRFVLAWFVFAFIAIVGLTGCPEPPPPSEQSNQEQPSTSDSIDAGSTEPSKETTPDTLKQEPPTEPSKEPAAEPTTESVSEPITEPTSEPPPNDSSDGGVVTPPETAPEATPELPEEVPLSKAVLLLESGNRQRGELKKSLLAPVVVRYLDRFQKALSNTEIVFIVLRGKGSLNGGKQSVTAKTDAQGRASVTWTMGVQEGFQQQQLSAAVKGSKDQPLTVVASAFEAGPADQTSFAGVVINNNAQPLAGISVYLTQTNKKSKVVKTDIGGRFVLTDLKDFVGQAHLVIEGDTEPSKDLYPRLEYEVFNIAGIANRLDGPIPLPKLEPTGTFTVDASKTTEVKPTKVTDFKMTIAAGSATFPDKKKSGVVNVSSVDPYWVPMPPPDGFASSMVVTIQPPGVRFNPPAPITFPNADKAAPGKRVPIFSFDHAKGRYVQVAMGIVSADGKRIESLPGQGVATGGWHLAAQISSQRTTVDDCDKRKGTLKIFKSVAPCPTTKDGPSSFVETKPDPKQPSGSTTKRVDPITLHSGALVSSYVDLSVPGRGLSFRWVRSYHSRIQYHGPLGHNWDHNYNIRLTRQGNDDIVLSHGLGRADRFVFNTQTKSYKAPAHLYAELSQLTNKSYVVKWRGGLIQTFDKDGRLRTTRDRNNNEMSFFYNLHLQLTRVVDPVGRSYHIAYNTNGHVAEVRDFTGRRVQYGYDDNDMLVTVLSPATQRFPKGKSHTYTYSTGNNDPVLDYNLLTATDAKGQKYLENTYDNQDRVVGQKYGTGTYTIAYQEINASSNPSDLTVVRTITTFTDAEKNVTKYHFNSQGNALKTEQVSRKLRPSDPASWVTTTSYNQNGRPSKITYPNGNSLSLTYDTQNADRLAHGNVLSILWTSHLTTDKHKTLRRNMTYEGRYQFLKTSVDPRGTCSGCDAKRYTTTLLYDFDESQLGDQNGDGKTNGSAGNLVKIILPTATLPDSKKQTRSLLFTHNAFGQELTTTDPMGIVTQYSYYASNQKEGDASDREGYIKSVIRDAKGLKLTSSFGYDVLGNLTAYTSPRGHTTRYHYNARNQRLVRIAPAPFHYKTFYQYDINDKLVEMRHENKLPTGKLDLDHPYLVSRFKYNLLNNLVELQKEVTPGKWLIKKWERDTLERVTKVIRPAGNAKCYTYDDRNRLLMLVRGCGASNAATTTYTYNKNGLLSLIKKPEGEEIKRFYDGYNRLIRTLDPLGASVEYDYDQQGNRTSVRRKGTDQGKKDVLLGQIDRLYDEANRSIERTSHLFATPGGTVTQHKRRYFFDANNGLVRKVDRRGNAWTYQYDSAHRYIGSTGPEGNSTKRTLDALGLTTRFERKVVGTTTGITGKTYFSTYQYDALNRKTQSVNNLGHTQRYSYDSRGNIRELIDPLGEISQTTYDGVNRLLTTTRVLRKGTNVTGKITRSYRWDDNDRLVARIDDNKNTTTYRYDSLDRRIEMQYPGGTQKRVWTYDKNGRMLTQTDPNGTVRKYTYNQASRVTKIDITRGTGVGGVSSLQYMYDGRHRVTQVKNNHSTVTYSYDSWSRRLQETLNGKVTTSSYDLSGNRLSMLYPGGTQLGYTYDKRHRLRNITPKGQSNPLVVYDYLGSRMVQKKLDNGDLLRRTLDAIGRITEHKTLNASNTLLTGFGYGYNKANHRTFKQDLFQNKVAQVYQYDSLYRLLGVAYGIADASKEVATPGSQQSSRRVQYTLDGEGNRIQVKDGTQTTSYQTNNLLQYSKVGSQALVYDSNGNLQDDGTQTYQYDFANRLIAIRKKQGNTLLASYRYGPLGRRIEKTVGSKVTRFLYDRARILEERDGSDKVTSHYTFGRRIDERLSMTQGGKSYRYQHNLLGSVVGLSDATGKIVERVRYDVFGQASFFDDQNKTMTASKVGNPYLFTGRRFDQENGLYHYRARAYKPQWGRFLQRDPKGTVDGPNLYSYTGGNPLSYTDPLGTEKYDRSKLSNDPEIRILEMERDAANSRRRTYFRRKNAKEQKRRNELLNERYAARKREKAALDSKLAALKERAKYRRAQGKTEIGKLLSPIQLKLNYEDEVKSRKAYYKRQYEANAQAAEEYAKRVAKEQDKEMEKRNRAYQEEYEREQAALAEAPDDEEYEEYKPTKQEVIDQYHQDVAAMENTGYPIEETLEERLVEYGFLSKVPKQEPTSTPTPFTITLGQPGRKGNVNDVAIFFILPKDLTTFTVPIKGNPVISSTPVPVDSEDDLIELGDGESIL